MMFTNHRSSAEEKYFASPGSEGWCRQSVVSLPELRTFTEQVMTAMRYAGYPAKDIFGLRLALEEAVVNAIKHGHKGRPAQPVRVRYQVTPEQVLVEVEDQGPGFDPHKVPSPVSAANLDNASGRGLYLMRSYTTWMRYNERGNRVTFCKRRSADSF